MSAQTIYGGADVAQLLRVTRAAVSNYQARHSDTPAPDYVTVDGRQFWTSASMASWLRWQKNRRADGPPQFSGRERAIETLRAELEAK